MSHIENPESWLKRINDEFCSTKTREGNVWVLERRDLNDPEIEEVVVSTHDFRLAKSVDLVIIGPGSSVFCGLEQCSIDFPMGRDCSNKSWVHALIERRQPKTVLVYARCCGTYPREYEDMLRRAIPTIEWLTPPMEDLSDFSWMKEDGVRRLVEHGVLAPVD